MAEADRYPSPPPRANGLPFYDSPAQQQQPQQQQYHHPQQPQQQHIEQGRDDAATALEHTINDGHGNELQAGGSPASLGGEMRDTRRTAPDSDNNQQQMQHMRPHLAPSAPGGNQMGSFGNFGQVPGHMTPTNGMHAGAPQGSVAYAQAIGLPDAAPPAPDKHKDKRTKVSRACDECRRKKIRCDAIDETGTVPCTNCARYVHYARVCIYHS